MPESTAILSNRATDEAAIAALSAGLCAAWDTGDAEAYAALFTPEGDYIAFDGTHARGRRAIAAMHRPLFARFLKGSRLVISSSATKQLTDDVALIHLTGAVLRRGQRQPHPSRLSIQTLVAIKEAGDWRFAAFQNTRYRPFATTLLGKTLIRLGIAPPPDVPTQDEKIG